MNILERDPTSISLGKKRPVRAIFKKSRNLLEVQIIPQTYLDRLSGSRFCSPTSPLDHLLEKFVCCQRFPTSLHLGLIGRLDSVKNKGHV